MPNTQEFIVGNPGSFHNGRWYGQGAHIRVPESELPSVTWFWPNGAPVEIDVKTTPDGVKKRLRPMGEPPAEPKPPTEAEEIADLEKRLEARKAALKAKEQPALSEVKNPPKSPGTQDGNAPKPKGNRPSDQDPA
jgi:hypothetical protein